MDKYILLLPVIIAYIAVLLTYRGHVKPKNNVWFGVTLPPKALTDNRLQHLRRSYNKSYTVYFVGVLLTIAPLLWLGSYFSLSLIYTLMWFAAFLYTSRLPYIRIHQQAAKLKQDLNWFVGEPRTVRIDARLDKLRQAKTLSPFWFAIPAIIGLVPIIVSYPRGDELLRMTGIASLAMTAVLFGFSAAFARIKPKPFSSVEAVDDAIYRTGGRYWSILWLGMAVFESVCAIVAYVILSEGNSSSYGFWLIGILFASLVPLAGIFYVHNRVATLTGELAHTDGQAVLADDDEYWLNGSTYYNPNDRTIIVAKRAGIGTTVNLATRAGKWIQYGTIVVALAVVVPLAAFAVKSDYTSPVLTIADEGLVQINYTPYDFRFSLDEALEITLEDTVPTGFRTGGTATSAYARGSFSLHSLGKAKLYVYKNNPPYIVIKLPDLYVIYNEKEADQTKAVYEELIEAQKQRMT